MGRQTGTTGRQQGAIGWLCRCGRSFEQFEIVLDVGTARVLGLRDAQCLACARVVAAQHVGIALVVEDLRRRPDDLDRLLVGAVGELEPAQPVIGGREPDPGLGVARMLLDGTAEVALGETEIAGAEVLLAEAEVVVRDRCRAVPRNGIRLARSRSDPVASADVRSPPRSGPGSCSRFLKPNRSPSLVDVSQPLSQIEAHDRRQEDSTRTRRCHQRAPRDPGGRIQAPGAKARARRSDTASKGNPSPKLGDEG